MMDLVSSTSQTVHVESLCGHSQLFDKKLLCLTDLHIVQYKMTMSKVVVGSVLWFNVLEYHGQS